MLENCARGSEGRLAFPYQRVGMINALQELSSAPSAKPLSKLSSSICSFLMSYYKDEGNEEVKLATLSALASWASQFAAVISSLVGPLIQLVKTGFTKAVQRLDGIYALMLIAKIAAVDTKAEEYVEREKIWSLTSQSEPSLIQVSMAAKLGVEDCLACVDAINVLLVHHTKRVLDAFQVDRLCQLIFFLVCHPTWAVRKEAYGATKRIIGASDRIAEGVLDEFSNFLSTVADLRLLKASEMENSLESQVTSLPSVEVVVKALLVISSAAVFVSPATCSHILFCSHHPSVVGNAKKNAVWRKVVKCLQSTGFDVLGNIAANVARFCQNLLGNRGLMGANSMEQRAAIDSLSTLMSIAPNDTYNKFQQHMLNLPDRDAHDALSPNDIQVQVFNGWICFGVRDLVWLGFWVVLYLVDHGSGGYGGMIFNTPEGILSSEVGVYVAPGASEHTKGSPEDQNGKVNHSMKRESNHREAAASGKKDTSKTSKKTDKGKTAKEEARELLLKEETSVREKVRSIQRNLALVLRALGEIAVSNPVFAHSQLSSLVRFVNPLLQSPIVSDAAYDTLVKLSRCLAPPLCNFALDIATGLRLIVAEESHVVWDLIPLFVGEETDEMQRPSLFERITNELSVSCKFGPLPVDTFKFVFPIMERILLSSKRTVLHDDVLRVLYLHMDPVLPLPRLQMISVLYRTLAVIPAYQAPIGSALNELCLGLQIDEIAPVCASWSVCKRRTCANRLLNAIKCIPAVAGRSLPENVEVATNIWIALHDPEKAVAEAAEDLWDRYGYDMGTDYSGLLEALSHVNFNVRLAAAEALAAALDEYPDTIQECLSTLFSLYMRDADNEEGDVDSGWLGRQGVALALHSSADVLRTKDLPVVMTFLISRALADPNADVRSRMINVGILIIDKHGKANVQLLFPIFENYLNKKSLNEEKYDLVREGVVIFTGALAKHLVKDDPKIHTVVEKLLDVLNTPSEAVQRAVSACLSPLTPSKEVCSYLSHGMLSEILSCSIFPVPMDLL
ncbi:ILITYHIA-like protein [Drosera capensis]